MYTGKMKFTSISHRSDHPKCIWRKSQTFSCCKKLGHSGPSLQLTIGQTKIAVFGLLNVSPAVTKGDAFVCLRKWCDITPGKKPLGESGMPHSRV